MATGTASLPAGSTCQRGPRAEKTRRSGCRVVEHNCIELRLASSGGLHAWELQHEGRGLEVRVRGQLTFSGAYYPSRRQSSRALALVIDAIRLKSF
jgi:hypothetical protein